MKNILIELILTNQCNKRCEYCDLDFKNNNLSYEDIDLFINFLKNNEANYTINFFGGEPLIEFDKIKYFVINSLNYVNKYSIGTNGLLLNKDRLYFFEKNDIKIYLSIDNISKGNDLNLEIIKDYRDIININFINDPDYLNNSIYTFERIKSYGFKNISFMPVFSTKKRSKDKLILLNKVYDFVINNSDNINTFSYFNGVSIDKQFILDTDLNFYSDLDSLLWLQKQYKIVKETLGDKINSETKLAGLHDKDLSLLKLLNLYNIEKIIKLVYEIPKKNGDLVSYKIIDKILKNNS